MDAEAPVMEVFSLFEQFGEIDYIGEAVTQVQHALQAAHLAEKEEFPEEIVLGALLHDVGHLIGMRDGRARMTTKGMTLGTANHEVIGQPRCILSCPYEYVFFHYYYHQIGDISRYLTC
ncbi:uncharacterized protein LOC122255377 [Penaeus japonicus]|uniref:uncharacterized protein LOC122255377 n=1 Tax=Penaeus japonicus TaxID=27405 RepID=UPI001C710F32|nr:uncharacterized protein LOC122255377 [Penaeus japonicus]XP_042875355.1 uncharacterized protein LOC122255377 [Penaeus japonicus]